MAALRTISLRLRGTSTKELEEAGEDTEGVVESKSKLRTKIQGYTGIDILTDSGAYKSTYEILLEISKVWDDLTDQDRAGLLELIAGKTRSNAAAAILSNTKDLEKAYKSAMEAEGSAMRENEKYLDSIQGKIDQFNNAIQTMWSNTLDSDAIKMVIELGTKLIKIVDKLGLVQTIVFGLMARMTIFSKKKIDLASILGIRDVEKGWTFGKEGLTGWLKKRFGKKSSITESIVGNPKDVKVDAKAYAEAISDNISDYVKVDTSEIDTQIDSITQRLNVAREQLTDAKAKDWDYYKSLGSIAPAKDKDNRIVEKQKEVAALEGQLTELQTKRSEIITKVALDAADATVGTPAPQTSKYLDIFTNGLGKGTKPLSVNLDVLAGKLKDIEGLDGEGLRTYMNNLADLGDEADDTNIALAGYASTVTDGTYTIQGAQKYIREYNQGLVDMSRKAQMAQFQQNLLNLAISAATMLLTALITHFINQAAKAEDEFEKLSSQLNATKSDLDNINSELEDTNEKIKDLQNQGTLSFTDQEELERLKSVNEELERQKSLKESIQKQQQKGVNSATVKAANDYYKKTGKDSGKTTSEMAGEGAKYGTMAGAAIAGAGAATAVSSSITAALAAAGTTVAPGVGTLIGVLAGLVITGVGAAVGAGIGAGIGAAEEKVGESMENMRERYAELQAEYEAAQSKYATDGKDNSYKKMQEAQEKLIEYESMMANNLAEMDAYYSQIDLSVYDPVADADEIARLRKEMNDFYDTQDQWLIQSKSANAKENAISRIFGENADNKLKRVKEKIEEALSTGEDFDIETIFDDPESYNAFMARLHEMGIYVYEVENYFKDMKEAEEEAADVSLDGVAKDIEKITEGLEGLKSAFDEVIEKGILSAKTIVGLESTFGSFGDVWDNYVSTMISGVASTEEMTRVTEELAEAFIDSKIFSGELTEESKWAYIAQLRSLGIDNAEEYVNDKLQENMYRQVAKSAKFDNQHVMREYFKRNLPMLFKTDEDVDKYVEEHPDILKTWENYTQDELQAIAIEWDISPTISDEDIKKIAEQYGVEESAIQGVIDKLEEKAKLEQDMLKIQKQQDAYRTWFAEGDGSYQATKEALDIAKNNPVAIQAQAILDRYNDDKQGGLPDYRIVGHDGVELKGSDYYWNGTKYDTIQHLIIDLKRITSDYQTKLKSAQDEFDAVIEEGKAKGYVNEDGTLKEGVEQAFADAYEAAKQGVKEWDNVIPSELTADVQMRINLLNASDQVDKIQDIFDTLKNAQKEYEDKGYVSVDTMQTLLLLEPKYLDLLVDENGKLNLNEQALHDVARARIIDLGIKQQSAILDKALALAEKADSQAMLEQIAVMETATDTGADFVSIKMAEIKALLATKVAVGDLTQEEADAFIQGTMNQIKAAQTVTKSALDNLDNTLSTSGNTATAETESQLERIQQRYERQISNKTNQQDYIQNEIDRLEAEDEAVSASYYEKQIALEEDKLGLYESQRTELSNLLNDTAKGSDEWYEIANALWEVEHSIQESTMSVIEFRKSIAELYETAFNDIITAYDNKDDFLSDQQNYIDKYQELMELQGEAPTKSSITAQLDIETAKMTANENQLKALKETLADGVESGAIKEGSDEWIKMQDEIRTTEAAILDNKIAIAEYNKELKQLYVDAFELMRNAFSSKDTFLTNQQNYIEGYADYLEALSIDAPAELYEELIAIEQKKRENNIANLRDARTGLLAIEAQGYTAADEEWQDAYNQVVEIEKAIQDSDIAMAEWEKTIRDMDFEKFDRFLSRLDNINSEIEHLKRLLADEDVATEDGEWTDEGITTLGLLYQQMEYAEQKSTEYANKIDELNTSYQNGAMSEQEYYERLQELKEGQWDSIEAYEDAKDAIIDMEEARIDMIEEGLNEEIEAYQDLINLKKEELDAERDLYDFKKKIKDQTKDIAQLERRIASLSGSDNASDIAERRKLQADLREAQEGLDDAYYDHSKNQQSQALDEEMDAFQTAKADYIEALRDTLEETEAVITRILTEVMNNATLVSDTINATAAEHGVTLTTSLTSPWVAASASSNTFKSTVEADIAAIKTAVMNSTSELTSNLQLPWNNTTNEEGPISTFNTSVSDAIDSAVTKAQNHIANMTTSLTQPWRDGNKAIQTFSSHVDTALDKAVKKAEEASEKISKTLNVSTPDYDGGGGNGDNGGGGSLEGNTSTYSPYYASLQEVLNTIFNAGLKVDGMMGPKTTAALKSAQKLMGITADGVYGTNTRDSIIKYIDNQIAKWKSENGSSMIQQGIQLWLNAKKKLPIPSPTFSSVAKYAKGTLGTTHDAFAITDESWIGEEITLAAGKNGQLQYLKKGSAVMPADISANLVEWGKLNPDMLKIGGGANLNMISNAVNKPELNFSFDSLVHVDNCSQDTLKDLEKMVDNKINQFTKRLNYSLKGIGAK